MGEACVVCGGGFTPEEWEEHHSNYDPDDPDPLGVLEVAHAGCCEFCALERSVDHEAFHRERG